MREELETLFNQHLTRTTKVVVDNKTIYLCDGDLSMTLDNVGILIEGNGESAYPYADLDVKQLLGDAQRKGIAFSADAGTLPKRFEVWLNKRKEYQNAIIITQNTLKSLKDELRSLDI